MFAYGIFKVLYSPRKAFKEIIQNPKYIGPILIMILFVLANIAFIFTVSNRTYVEQTMPTRDQRDVWTENATLWTAVIGETPTANQNDYINGTNYYGNKSIQFTSQNNSQIAMQTTNIGTVNCSGPNGFTQLSFRVKRISPPNAPSNVTIYLFSGSISDYFSYNLTEEFSNSSTNVWSNLTIPLVTGWLSNGTNADWNNITGIRFDFAWTETSNMTLLIDGLFFRGVYKMAIENISNYLVTFSVYSIMQFILKWVFFGGLMYIMVKMLFKSEVVWKPMLISAGYALMPLVVQAVLDVALFSTLPTLHYPLEFFSGVGGESLIAQNAILEKTWFVLQISSYVELAAILWTIALGAIATRLLTAFSWSKSALISMVAYFVAMVAQSFLLGT